MSYHSDHLTPQAVHWDHVSECHWPDELFMWLQGLVQDYPTLISHPQKLSVHQHIDLWVTEDHSLGLKTAEQH